MAELRQYSEVAVISFPLQMLGSQNYLAGATIAAGDAKISKDDGAFTSLTIERIAFTSGGTYEVLRGDLVVGEISGAAGVVGHIVLSSGSWAGGNAAGVFWLYSKTGTFQSENLDVGANANVATVAGDSIAGLFGEVAEGYYYAVLAPTEMQFRRITLKIVDQTATKEWEDQSILIETYDANGGTQVPQHAFNLNNELDSNVISDAVWDSVVSQHLTAGTFGVQCGTDIDAILADTAELQTDWVDGGRLDLIVDAILADTNELQTDWTNGGRLDLIIDELTVNVDAVEADTQNIQTRLPAALVGGKIDASIGAIIAGTITAAAFAADALAAASMAADFAEKITDIAVRRSLATIRASSFGDFPSRRSMLGAFSALVNAWFPSGDTIAFTTEDDVTTFYTRAPTTDRNAKPIKRLD